MAPKNIYIFGSREYWYYKILDICFCITYPPSDDEENEENWKKTPESSETPLCVPNTAIIEREKVQEKEIMLHGCPDECL